MGGFQGAALLDAPDDRQQLGGGDLADRAVPDPGEDVALQAPDDAVCVGVGPVLGVLVEPLPRDRGEAVLVGEDAGELTLAPLVAGIDAGRQLLLRLVAQLAGLGEAHLRLGSPRLLIYPQGEQLLLAGEAVLEAPVFRAVRGHQQEQAPAGGELIGLLLGLRLVGRQVGERRQSHSRYPHGCAGYPRMYPHKYPRIAIDGIGRYRTA